MTPRPGTETETECKMQDPLYMITPKGKVTIVDSPHLVTDINITSTLSHTGDGSPSFWEVNEDWAEAYNTTDENNTAPSKENKQFGKWLIFRDINDIEQVWEKVKAASLEGQLGYMSSRSPIIPNPSGSRASDTAVICVYTYDEDDLEDVMRVRKTLTDLEIIPTNEVLCYRTSHDTYDVRFSQRGHRNISKWIA